MRISPIAAAVLCALPFSSARAEAPIPQPPVVAVLGFGANPAASGQAPAVEALIASHLAEAEPIKVITQADLATLLDVERQRQILGTAEECSESCMTELAGAVGARFVVNGRVDRFGEQYVLIANLFDSIASKVLVKGRVNANEPGIPDATRQLAAELLEGLGKTPPSPEMAHAGRSEGGVVSGAAPAHRAFSLGLRVGNAFVANVIALNFSGDLEFGWAFEPDWVAWLQVGVTLVRQRSDFLPESFVILPSVIGARHLYRIEHTFQPYWGLGLGVQLALGDFAVFQQTGPLPTVIGVVGFQYFVTERFSLGLEGSTNLAQTVLGFTRDAHGNGFNLDLNGALTWRF